LAAAPSGHSAVSDLSEDPSCPRSAALSWCAQPLEVHTSTMCFSTSSATLWSSLLSGCDASAMRGSIAPSSRRQYRS
jgi:hypothetical protein